MHLRKRQLQRGLTLIELIGVLAIIAILAASLVPVLIRQMDRIAGEQESASLKSMGAAFEQSVLRNRYIPTYTNWASAVATELGVNVSNVTTNGRKQPRFFLIDTNLSIGGGGLPYPQPAAGCAAEPANARVLILSSIGQRLTAMGSGIPAAADFNAIWNWNDASSIPPATSLLAGLTKGDDLKVERVNLSPWFVSLWLTTYASHAGAAYSIDSTNLNTATTVTEGSGVHGYFIQNSVLSLFKHTGELDSQQVLIRNNSFVYNIDVWRGSIAGGAFLGGLDIASVVDKFMSAPYNTRAAYTNRQQGIIVTNMMNYMDAYRVWAAAGFPNGGLKTTVNDRQQDMVLSVRQLFEANAWNPNEGCP